MGNPEAPTCRIQNPDIPRAGRVERPAERPGGVGQDSVPTELFAQERKVHRPCGHRCPSARVLSNRTSIGPTARAASSPKRFFIRRSVVQLEDFLDKASAASRHRCSFRSFQKKLSKPPRSESQRQGESEKDFGARALQVIEMSPLMPRRKLNTKAATIWRCGTTEVKGLTHRQFLS